MRVDTEAPPAASARDEGDEGNNGGNDDSLSQ